MTKDKASILHRQPAVARWLAMLFADALSFATMFVSLVLFKRLGLGNDEVTFSASLLFIPWLLLPLMDKISPPFRNRRFLTAGLEGLSALLLVGVSFALREGASSNTLILLLWLVALCGALHSTVSKEMTHEGVTFAVHILPFMLAMTLCQGFIVAFAGNMEVMTRTIRGSWSTAFYVISALYALMAIAHCAIRYRTCEERETSGTATLLSSNSGARSFLNRGEWTMILLYTLLLIPEGLLTPASQLFLVDARHNGGLGLSPAEFGLSQGTIGIVAVVIGWMVAAILARHEKATRWQWPATVALAFPSISYIYMSHTMTDSLLVVCLCVSFRLLVDGFAFGICFHSLAGRFHSKALRFAVMSLPMIVCGMVSGAFQESMGYRTFFIVLLAFSPFVFVVMAIIRSINAMR